MSVRGRRLATCLLGLALSACATVYSVSFDPRGTFTGGPVIPDVPAEVTLLENEQLDLVIPLNLGPNRSAAACVYAGDMRAPGITVLRSQPSPRGGEVLRLRVAREALEGLRGSTLRIAVSPLPPGRTEQPQCPGDDQPGAQTYVMAVQSANQGRLLAAGVAGIAVVLVLTAGEL